MMENEQTEPPAPAEEQVEPPAEETPAQEPPAPGEKPKDAKTALLEAVEQDLMAKVGAIDLKGFNFSAAGHHAAETGRRKGQVARRRRQAHAGPDRCPPPTTAAKPKTMLEENGERAFQKEWAAKFGTNKTHFKQ